MLSHNILTLCRLQHPLSFLCFKTLYAHVRTSIYFSNFAPILWAIPTPKTEI